jgi:competence protein ComFC
MYEQICPVCQHPSIGGLTHPSCRTSWGIDGVVTLARYRGPVRPLVRQLKYGGATVVAQLVSPLVHYYKQHETLTLPPGIITGVPLHTHAYKRRGFNQADVIAQELGQATQYPVVTPILQRARDTATQTKLSKEERQRNLHNAFTLHPSVAKSELKGVTIILVDDVITTGATLREAAKVLKRAGVARVYGFTLAHD